MKRFDHCALEQKSRACLSDAAWDPKKLILIHTGAALCLSLLLTLVDQLLAQQIGTTGGLSGMDRRAVLSTVQSFLRLALLAALPFWNMGYVWVTLALAQKEPATPRSLLEGFRRWGAVLRLTLLETTLMLAVGMVSFQLGSLLFCLTPWADPLLEAVVRLMPNGMAAMDSAAMEALLEAADTVPALPLLSMVGLVALVLGGPLYYRFRFTGLYLMEHPEQGAIRALAESARRMRGNYGAMLGLDLHFLWFHGLNLLTVLLSYGDTLAAELGVSLPISSEAAFFLFPCVSALCQLALYWWRRNEVSVTYVHAYQKLAEPPVYTR